MSDETRTLLDQPIVATPEEIRSAQHVIREYAERHELPRGKFSQPEEHTMAGLLHMLTGPAPDPETKTQLAKRRKAARQEGVKIEEYERIPIVGPFDGVRD
jgi:hypothetical protein